MQEWIAPTVERAYDRLFLKPAMVPAGYVSTNPSINASSMLNTNNADGRVDVTAKISFQYVVGSDSTSVFTDNTFTGANDESGVPRNNQTVHVNEKLRKDNNAFRSHMMKVPNTLAEATPSLLGAASTAASLVTNSTLATTIGKFNAYYTNGLALPTQARLGVGNNIDTATNEPSAAWVVIHRSRLRWAPYHPLRTGSDCQVDGCQS